MNQCDSRLSEDFFLGIKARGPESIGDIRLQLDAVARKTGVRRADEGDTSSTTINFRIWEGTVNVDGAKLTSGTLEEGMSRMLI